MHRTALFVGICLALLLTARPAEAGDARRVRLVETAAGLARVSLEGRTIISSTVTPWAAPDGAWASANRGELLRLVLADSPRLPLGHLGLTATGEYPPVSPEIPRLMALPLPPTARGPHHLVVVTAALHGKSASTPVEFLVVATVTGRPGDLSCADRAFLRWDGDCALELRGLTARIVTLAQGLFLDLGFRVLGGTSGDHHEVWAHWFFLVGRDGGLAAAGDLVPRFWTADRYGRFAGRHRGTGCWWFEDLDGDGAQDLVVGRVDADHDPSRLDIHEYALAARPPVAYRVQCLWRDGRFHGTWRPSYDGFAPLFWSAGELLD